MVGAARLPCVGELERRQLTLQPPGEDVVRGGQSVVEPGMVVRDASGSSDRRPTHNRHDATHDDHQQCGLDSRGLKVEDGGSRRGSSGNTNADGEKRQCFPPPELDT